MARSRKKVSHTHRSVDEEGAVTCECGKEFSDDDAWRSHYERETTAEERKQAEQRDDPDA